MEDYRQSEMSEMALSVSEASPAAGAGFKRTSSGQANGLRKLLDRLFRTSSSSINASGAGKAGGRDTREGLLSTSSGGSSNGSDNIATPLTAGSMRDEDTPPVRPGLTPPGGQKPPRINGQRRPSLTLARTVPAAGVSIVVGSVDSSGSADSFAPLSKNMTRDSGEWEADIHMAVV